MPHPDALSTANQLAADPTSALVLQRLDELRAEFHQHAERVDVALYGTDDGRQLGLRAELLLVKERVSVLWRASGALALGIALALAGLFFRLLGHG